MGRSWDKTENDGWLIRNRGLYSPINVGFSQYIRVPFSTDRDDMVFEHCNDCNASSPGPQKNDHWFDRMSSAAGHSFPKKD